MSQPNEQVLVVFAPGATPSPQIVIIDDFYCSHGPSYEALLVKTVKKIGAKLEGELEPCSGCSQAKGSRKSIKPYTTTKSVKPERKVFVGLVGGKPVQSPG